MLEHHIWCNWQDTPAETCSLCARLREKYPQLAEDSDGSLLAKKYFPKAIILKSRSYKKRTRKVSDNCQVCKGSEGGVNGNENIIDGVVLCDYCSVKYDDLKEALNLKKLNNKVKLL